MVKVTITLDDPKPAQRLVNMEVEVAIRQGDAECHRPRRRQPVSDGLVAEHGDRADVASLYLNLELRRWPFATSSTGADVLWLPSRASRFR